MGVQRPLLNKAPAFFFFNLLKTSKVPFVLSTSIFITARNQPDLRRSELKSCRIIVLNKHARYSSCTWGSLFNIEVTEKNSIRTVLFCVLLSLKYFNLPICEVSGDLFFNSRLVRQLPQLNCQS